MKKAFTISLIILLTALSISPANAKVRKILDEKEILEFTERYQAVPSGLAVTSDDNFIFFETSTCSIMRYTPTSKSLEIVADTDSIFSAISPKRKNRDDDTPARFKRPSLTCHDLEVDSHDNIYALITNRSNNDTFAVKILNENGKYASPESITKVADKKLCIAELEIDQPRKQLVFVMDTYKGSDDAEFNGFYTLGIEDSNEGLNRLLSFGQIGEVVTDNLVAGEKPIGGTGLAIDGDFAYWHLTVGPANAHTADGDLIMINLDTKIAQVALDREQFIKDIGPQGLGPDGNFYFTTFDIDNHNLFMMTNVGVGERAQNVHHYYVDGNDFKYQGVAAYAQEILDASNDLGVPMIFYSTECQAKDKKFYLFSASNLTENLIEITPDYTTPKTVRVAVYSGPGGSGSGAVRALSMNPDIYVRKVSPQEIRDGILKDFDVVLQPGGSGSGQAKALQEKGCENIKNFVREGNGYIGICAGSYLASSGYEWSLHIINALSLERAHWNRGGCDLDVELTPMGRRIIDDIPGTVSIRYAQGAIYAPAGKPDLPPYQVLAYYREGVTELNNTKTTLNGAVEGFMRGMPAISIAQYGKGRVVAISPHPESSGSGIEYFVRNLARWAAKAKPCNTPDSIVQPNQDGIKYIPKK